MSFDWSPDVERRSTAELGVAQSSRESSALLPRSGECPRLRSLLAAAPTASRAARASFCRALALVAAFRSTRRYEFTNNQGERADRRIGVFHGAINADWPG